MKFKKKFNNESKVKTRKDLRKEKRQEKKQKKNEYFSNRKQLKTQQGKSDKAVLDKNDKVDVSEKKKVAIGKKKEKDLSKREKSEALSAGTLLEQQRNREKQMEKNIQIRSKSVRSKQLLKANEDEDKEIRKLEKLLNLNKRKSKKIPSSFVSDGLDYLLELCDSQKRQEISEYEAQTRLSDSESDFEADLAEVTGKKKTKKVKTKQKSKEDENGNADQSDEEIEGDLSGEDFDSEDIESESEGDFDDDLGSDNDDAFDDENSGSDSELGENEPPDDALDDENMETIENPFSDDDSVDEDDFDAFDDHNEDTDDETDNLESDDGRTKTSKRKLETTNATRGNKKVKFADEMSKTSNRKGKDKTETKSSKEERMKQLMGFVEKESGNVKEKKAKEDKKDSKPLSKEERMKRLMGFVENESGKDIEKEKNKPSKEISKGNEKEDKLSKGDRMKQLLGFVKDEEEKESGTEEEEDGTWEDIYGRSRDKDGNVIQEKSTKYVPPHLRNAGSTDNKESLALLKRQMKGLLNRLTENNIKSISTGIESLYTEHSRHDTNLTLLTLLRDSLLTQTLTPEKMMSEHAMLITVLHANIGTEIGASLLQTLVQEWDTLYRSPLCHSVDNKQLDNYLSLLADLYQFKVLTHTIVYDILDVLVETFEEKSIELMLTLLKSVGLSLRKDNAVRFKACLLAIQAKSNARPDLKEKPRTKFMLEILLCVKNNNVHKIPGYDVSTLQRMRGNLKFLIRPSCYVSELNIGLQDLLKADEKGRWWIVGSAWSGKESDGSKPDNRPSTVPDQFSSEILELARKQRMNTEVRRNVFCVLMSSEDYLDAYEKLLKLGIRQDQTDDIVNVIVHCLLNEKQYNPYYTHLANHFISSNRRYRMLAQYTVWDKFKLLNDMKPTQIVNLAKFLSALFVQHALPVSVLKVIEFTELTKHHVRLVRQIFLALLLLEDEESLRAVFGKITKAPELKLLREGLHLFLMTFVINKLPPDSASESERMRRNASLVGEILAPR